MTAVKTLLHNRNIPLGNIISFTADNCLTMMGATGGFQCLLRKEVPNVFVLSCVCYSFALCANAASKSFAILVRGFHYKQLLLFFT